MRSLLPEKPGYHCSPSCVRGLYFQTAGISVNNIILLFYLVIFNSIFIKINRKGSQKWCSRLSFSRLTTESYAI